MVAREHAARAAPVQLAARLGLHALVEEDVRQLGNDERDIADEPERLVRRRLAIS